MSVMPGFDGLRHQCWEATRPTDRSVPRRRKHQLTSSVSRRISAGMHSNPRGHHQEGLHRTYTGAPVEPSAEVAPELPRLQAHPQKGRLCCHCRRTITCGCSRRLLPPSHRPQARARVASCQSPSRQSDSVQETDLSVCSQRSSRSCSVTKSLPVCDRSSATVMTLGKTHSCPPTVGVQRNPSSMGQQGGRCLWVRECMLCLSKFKSRRFKASEEWSTWQGQWKDPHQSKPAFSFLSTARTNRRVSGATRSSVPERTHGSTCAADSQQSLVTERDLIDNSPGVQQRDS